MSTAYSVGQMNQLADALEGAGFTPGDVTKLRSFSRLPEIRSVLLGFSQIVVVKHVIDLDANPFVPDGWEVDEHIKGGQLEWNPAMVALYVSEDQQNGKVIQGLKLRKELKGKPVYNANLLDYLLAHPELIPESWKGQEVFFWGSIYRDRGGSLNVRYLHWNGSRWHWIFHLLDGVWRADDPAAVPASSS